MRLLVDSGEAPETLQCPDADVQLGFYRQPSRPRPPFRIALSLAKTKSSLLPIGCHHLGKNEEIKRRSLEGSVNQLITSQVAVFISTCKNQRDADEIKLLNAIIDLALITLRTRQCTRYCRDNRYLRTFD